MPRATQHPLALFSLVPLNERAEAVVARNGHLASWVEGQVALDIGHTRSSSGDNATLATLGRNGDVIVEGSSIAKIQCSFEIDLDTNVVMFYDRSHSQTSQVFGLSATPFEYGRPRKVVVQNNVNTIIGMGGVGRNLFQFELEWHHEPHQVMEMAKNRASTTFGYEENPRLARTVDEVDTVLPSQRETRPHTAGLQQPKLRYATIIELGSGQFGRVYKAVDVDSGRLMAVKKLKRPLEASEQEWRTRLQGPLRREVDILSRISHPHIVDYIASRGWNEGHVEIFMGLKEGTLQSLVRGGCSIPITDLGSTVFHHMLQAIDFLTVKGIVHRDIKPENILYVSRAGQYDFQLGDFGLSNRQFIATTFVGSILYMAPERFRHGQQTDKADVWSLYVTLLWTLDVEGFRDYSQMFKTPSDVQTAVLKVASQTDSVSSIREMARREPNERASAAQMLVKCFDGRGLTTPPNQVPPLIESVEADGKALARPASAPKNKRGLRRNVLPEAPFRVEKARSPQAQARQQIGPRTEKHPGPLGPRALAGLPTDSISTLATARRFT